MTDLSDVEGVDMRRLPHEIRQALDAETILVDTLTPGLATRFEAGDIVIVSAEGHDLARFPAYRLGAVDKAKVAAAVDEALANEPPEQAATIVAAGAELGGFELLDDPADLLALCPNCPVHAQCADAGTTERHGWWAGRPASGPRRPRDRHRGGL